ncbi:hypothetical protein [Marisediminicola senii]|uniref:hypothetical protein n=1 Tax=Marisediminicola senii TaxID=2711233 RepID=UPI0013ECB267|nr:hypothetical protein [Marisediminicola senii]
MGGSAAALDVLEAVFPWLGVALFVGSLVMVLVVYPRQLRKPDRLRDLQLGLNATPRITIVSAVLLAGYALMTALLGIAFVAAGYTFAWGMFPMAAAAVPYLGAFIYLWRLPFPGFDDGDDVGHGTVAH